MHNAIKRSSVGRAGFMDPGDPLWKIVPTRDEEGKPLSDFMMLIPGLRDRPEHHIQATLDQIHCALAQYHEVVFANMNLKLNLLWVSVRTRRRITVEVAAAIRNRVPEAVLIGDKPKSK
jgi:hypothetical protein